MEDINVTKNEVNVSTCKKCGSELSEEQQFCGICGTSIEVIEKKLKKPNKKVIVIVSVLLIGVITFGLIIFLRGNISMVDRSIVGEWKVYEAYENGEINSYRHYSNSPTLKIYTSHKSVFTISGESYDFSWSFEKYLEEGEPVFKFNADDGSTFKAWYEKETNSIYFMLNKNTTLIFGEKGN